jgi:hypothetical protein
MFPRVTFPANPHRDLTQVIKIWYQAKPSRNLVSLIDIYIYIYVYYSFFSELQAHPGSFQNSKKIGTHRIDLPKNKETMGGQKPVILTLYFFLCGFLFFLIVFLFVPISSYFFLCFLFFSYFSFFS